MYYVVRTGEEITMFHSSWTSYYNAVTEADNLKQTFNREYSVIRMELVYQTLTLENKEE